MSELAEKLKKAIEDHRCSCAGLAIRACGADSNGEEIRAALDQADTKLFDTIIAALSHEQTGWREIETAPKDGTPIYVRAQSVFRFQPYKPSSNEAKRGITGRWQAMNEYGGWENCSPPVGDWSLPTSPALSKGEEVRNV